MEKYEHPHFLERLGVSRDTYIRWLQRKAKAHARRDRKRGNEHAAISEYKFAIHQAVCHGGERDAYTGRQLKWKLISQYENAASKRGGRTYKRGFADMPTVDHEGDGRGSPQFRICAWRTNDAKSDLTHRDFVALCRRVVRHAERRRR